MTAQQKGKTPPELGGVFGGMSDIVIIDVATSVLLVRHNMKPDNKNTIPDGHKTFSIMLEPNPEKIPEFQEYLTNKINSLEAAGVVVTDVAGFTIHGHYDPTEVSFEDIQS